MYQLRVIQLPHQEPRIIEADHGQYLHQLLVSEAAYHAPCGGNKSCKKCKVKIVEVLPYSDEEKKFLTEEEQANHIHLACFITINQDLTVVIGDDEMYQIMQNRYYAEGATDPYVKRKVKKVAELKTEGIEDWATCLKQWVGAEKIGLGALRKIPDSVAMGQEKLTIVYDDIHVLDVYPGEHKGYGVAIDIGTTTVVAYLYQLETGRYEGHRAAINPQQNYGLDVISRIQYGSTTKGLQTLGGVILTQLNHMIGDMLEAHGLSKEQLDEIVIAGNTTMIHLLLQVSPTGLGASPFTAVFTEMIIEPARNIGFEVLDHCQAIVVPHIGAYVGGDIVSGVIATNLQRKEGYRLLLDIGTNGEIVLAKGEQLYCCATAAGPAFEGAKMSWGIGGVSGAINHVYEKEGKLAYTTIGDKPPIGLCGSGIIDVVAYLLDKGIVDETGYLEWEDDETFEIAKKEDGTPITLCQKDIRELQLAKAAIRAGIETLLKMSGIEADALEQVYLAGGFGNYMSKESAIKIGLIPEGLQDKMVTVGNAAGIGATLILLGMKSVRQCQNIKEASHLTELSQSAAFANAYIEHMGF